jgi:hypothetical protein
MAETKKRKLDETYLCELIDSHRTWHSHKP